MYTLVNQAFQLSGLLDRYGYGPVILSREAYAGTYDLVFSTGYAGSTVGIFRNRESLGSSGAGITLTGGTSSTLEIVVTNTESKVRLIYELVVIRPLPVCADSQLQAW